MGRKWWAWGLVVSGLAAAGCSSNPYRPTLFSRNRQPSMPSGPALDGPVMENTVMPEGGAYPVPPPMNYPPMNVVPSPAVPPSLPAPQPNLPQGPMPKEKPGGTTTNGSPKS